MKKVTSALLILVTFLYFAIAKHQSMDTNIEEIWKDIIGYESTHQVSSLGRIKSKSRPQKHKSDSVFIKREYILKIRPGTAFNGYTTILLSKVQGSQDGFFLHRIVATAFVPNPENKPFVNHINGIKTDCRAINLEWCTRSENAKHAISIGLQKVRRGVEHSMCKLSMDNVIEIRSRYKNGESTYAIFNSNDYKISYTNIKDIVARRLWDHI